MTALAELLIGDSAVLLYLSESMTRNRNSILYSPFSEFVYVLLSKVFLSFVDQTR